MDANQTAITTDADELAQLERLEAEQAKELETLTAGQRNVDTDEAADRAAAGGEPEASQPKPNPADTPSASDKEKQEIESATAEAEKEGKELDTDDKGVPKRDAEGKFVKREKKAAEPAYTPTDAERDTYAKVSKHLQSKYGHDEAKKMLRWEKIKEAETALEKAKKDNETKLNGAIARFNADVLAFRNEQSTSRPSPEKYEAFSKQCLDTAKVKRAEAITAENEGRTEDADKLNREALILENRSEEATAAAENIRKNPPPSEKQRQEKFVADQKTWIDKAAIDFPEFAKKDSEVQKQAAEYFKQITASEPMVAKLPGFIYFCAERAFHKSAADRVPAMEKELGELRSKVKELEALTNPVPGGVVRQPSAAKKFEDMTPDEQFAQLQTEAANMR